MRQCVRLNKQEQRVQNTAALGKEDQISLVTAVHIFLASA